MKSQENHTHRAPFGDLAALDRLDLSESEIKSIISDTARFIAGLAPTIRQSAPDEAQAALRRCVETVTIDREKNIARISLRTVPTVLGGEGAGGIEALDVII